MHDVRYLTSMQLASTSLLLLAQCGSPVYLLSAEVRAGLGRDRSSAKPMGPVEEKSVNLHGVICCWVVL